MPERIFAGCRITARRNGQAVKGARFQGGIDYVAPDNTFQNVFRRTSRTNKRGDAYVERVFPNGSTGFERLAGASIWGFGAAGRNNKRVDSITADCTVTELGSSPNSNWINGPGLDKNRYRIVNGVSLQPPSWDDETNTLTTAEGQWKLVLRDFTKTASQIEVTWTKVGGGVNLLGGFYVIQDTFVNQNLSVSITWESGTPVTFTR